MSTERGSASAGPLSAYLGELPPDVAAALGVIVARARVLLPGVAEGTGYGMPCLVYRGRPLLSVRETTQHLACYPFSPAAVEAVAAELSGSSLSKGAVRFTAEQPLSAEVIDRLILVRREEIDAALDR